MALFNYDPHEPRPDRRHDSGIFTAFVSRLLAWNATRVTRKALMKLSERELDDIGLYRGDIRTWPSAACAADRPDRPGQAKAAPGPLRRGVFTSALRLAGNVSRGPVA